MYTRTRALLGDEKLETLISSKVLIVGLGGVGGYAAEALARAGVGTLGLCDFDVVDITNKNRQILALDSTVGLHKAQVSAARIADINPDCHTEVFDMKLSEENLDVLHLKDWGFVVDAVDDVSAKLLLIQKCGEYGIPMISSMGTGNKMDPSRFRVCDIEETEGDPLARSMRKKLRKMEISGVKVLFSDEPPVHPGKRPIPTISYMPAVAGLELAAYAIKKILENM